MNPKDVLRQVNNRLIAAGNPIIIERPVAPRQSDFTVNGGGSIYLLEPNTDAAKAWVAEHLPEDAQWFGRCVAIEHRYVGDILRGIDGDGLVIDC